jgi:hypothetical protein
VLTGRNLAVSNETHHKAQQDVINEDQPICDHFPRTVLIYFQQQLYTYHNCKNCMLLLTTRKRGTAYTSHVWWRAPKQMLRTHCSLEAYCATLWWRWLVFSFFCVTEHRWNEIDKGKPKYSGETCPNVTLSTTNPTWTDPGSNLGLRGERPATNHLSHGMTFTSHVDQCQYMSATI